MSTSVDVSIALPLYNGRTFVRQAIESILSQEDVALEIIAVDDGSNDGTAELVENLRDERIHVLRNSANRGIFPTLNRAVRAGNAPRVQIFCQDDLMHPGCLAAQCEHLALTPDTVMTWCGYGDVGPEGKPCGDQSNPDYQERLPPVLSPATAACYFLVYGCMPGNLSPVMLRRETFDAAGGFNETMTYAGDFDLWVRLAARGEMNYKPKKLMSVRTHPDRASEALNAQHLKLIAEEAAVYNALSASMGDRGDPREIMRYLAAVRGYQYIAWIVDHLRKGHPRIASQGLRDVHRFLGIARCMLAYVLSLNGRRRMFDRDAMLGRLLK